MDWFDRLTGFRESGYARTRERLGVEGRELVSRVNGRRYQVGDLELVSLRSLRERVLSGGELTGRLKVRIVRGNVRHMHQVPDHPGALFQVASQFNLLEMTGPEVTPEHGVTRYEGDATQGPACAIAAGAATIYRNYFAPVADGFGQTHDRQLDGLADVGTALSIALGKPVGDLWAMRNGYAMCTRDGLADIAEHLLRAGEEGRDALRGRLRIGLHSDVEVTDAEGPQRPKVSQAFCSALPVRYCGLPGAPWQPFAQLVLEAAYEATLLAAVLNAKRGASNVVLLTRLGGGAFGNDGQWIDAAMRRALALLAGSNLEVRLVSLGEPSNGLRELVRQFH